MDYKLLVNDREYAVDVSPPNEDGLRAVKVNGTSSDVNVTAISPNHYHVVVDGCGVNLFVARAEDGTWVSVEGRARLIQDAEQVHRRTSRGPGARTREVAPLTPAEVVAIMVEVGQEVSEGQDVVMVSAMKMKMTLTAPYSGTVTAINAKPGDRVDRGKILVEIEPLQEDKSNG